MFQNYILFLSFFIHVYSEITLASYHFLAIPYFIYIAALVLTYYHATNFTPQKLDQIALFLFLMQCSQDKVPHSWLNSLCHFSKVPINICLFVFLAEAVMPTPLVAAAVLFIAGGIEVVRMHYVNGKDHSFLFYCLSSSK